MFAPSAQICFFVIKLEINQRSEHLNVGYERVHLGQSLRVSVEVAHERFWVALLHAIGAVAVRFSLSLQISSGIRNLFIGIRNANRSILAEMIGNVGNVEISLSKERISRHDRLRDDRPRVNEVGYVPFVGIFAPDTCQVRTGAF